jgi:hypothetical protein
LVQQSNAGAVILVLLMFSGGLLKAGTIGLIKHFN